MAQENTQRFIGGSGGELILFLQSAFAAVESMQKGPTAPANPRAGMSWLDDAGTPFVLKRYLNNQWQVEGYWYASEGVFRAATRNRVLVRSSAYNVTLDDIGAVIAVDATDGPVIVSLPAAATAKNGFPVTFIKLDATANPVTLEAVGTDIIGAGGSGTLTLGAQGGAATLVSDGAAVWHRTDRAELPDNSVSEAKLVDEAVTARKIHPEARIPPGAVAAFAMSTPPAGWLECNGATVSRTTYADLFAAIGTTHGAGDGSTTFRLPDYRGEFLRGWDNGRGIDSGRAFGSFQSDALQNITGRIRTGTRKIDQHTDNTTGAFATVSSGDDTAGYEGGVNAKTYEDRTFDASRVARTASETRPRNRAVMFCIKY